MREKIKAAWSALVAKRTAVGWLFALLGALLCLSDKWDSLNSFWGKVKNMGPAWKFIVDGSHSPVVQLAVFITGAIWIGIAALISARRTGSSFAGVTFGDAVFFSADRDGGTQLLRCMEKPTTAHFSGIKVAYDKDSMDCMLPTTFRRKHQSEAKGAIARLRIDSETKSNISECKAVITSLDANSRTLVSGVQLPLLFTPAQSPGSDTKAIRYGQPEYLEVLWIPNSGEAEIMTSFPFAFTEYQTLNRLSAYSLSIAFSVDNVITTAIVDAAYTSGVWMLSIRRHSRSTPNTEASPHLPTS